MYIYIYILSVAEWWPDDDPFGSKHVATITSTRVSCVSGFIYLLTDILRFC